MIDNSILLKACFVEEYLIKFNCKSGNNVVTKNKTSYKGARTK